MEEELRKCYTCKLELDKDFLICTKCERRYHLNCCMLLEKAEDFYCGLCLYDEDHRDCICCGFENGGMIEDNYNIMHARCRYWSQMQTGPCIVCLNGIENQFVAKCIDCKLNSYHIPCALEKGLLLLDNGINLFKEPPNDFRCVECRNKVLSKELGIKPVFNGVELVAERKTVIEISSTSESDSIETEESDTLTDMMELTGNKFTNPPKRQKFLGVFLPKKRKNSFTTSNSKRQHYYDSSDELAYVLTPEELDKRLKEARRHLEICQRTNVNLTQEVNDLDSKIEEIKSQLQEVEEKSSISRFENNPDECFFMEQSIMAFADRINGTYNDFPSMVEFVNVCLMSNKDADKLIEIHEDIHASTTNKSTQLKLDREIFELKSKKERLSARMSELSGQIAASGDYQDMANLCRQFLSNISTNAEVDKYTNLPKQLSEIIADFEDLDPEMLKYLSSHAFNTVSIYHNEE